MLHKTGRADSSLIKVDLDGDNITIWGDNGLLEIEIVDINNIENL